MKTLFKGGTLVTGQGLRKADLLELFEKAAGKELAGDRTLLS